MRDEGEVGEVPLDSRLQDRRRSRVSERRSVLVQQIQQLLQSLPAIGNEVHQNHFSYSMV